MDIMLSCSIYVLLCYLAVRVWGMAHPVLVCSCVKPFLQPCLYCHEGISLSGSGLVPYPGSWGS